jgi:hypothetical protein
MSEAMEALETMFKEQATQKANIMAIEYYRATDKYERKQERNKRTNEISAKDREQLKTIGRKTLLTRPTKKCAKHADTFGKTIQHEHPTHAHAVQARYDATKWRSTRALPVDGSGYYNTTTQRSESRRQRKPYEGR